MPYHPKKLTLKSNKKNLANAVNNKFCVIFSKQTLRNPCSKFSLYISQEQSSAF